MVPQQSQDGSTATTQSEQNSNEQNDSMAIEDHDENLTVFGSQQVKETSNTPYSDATKVSNYSYMIKLLKDKIYDYSWIKSFGNIYVCIDENQKSLSGINIFEGFRLWY